MAHGGGWRPMGAGLLVLGLLVMVAGSALAAAPPWEDHLPAHDAVHPFARHLHAHSAGHAGPAPEPPLDGLPAAAPGPELAVGAAASVIALGLLAPLYTRRSATKLLEHPLRQRLHALVRSQPGASLAELAASTGRTRAIVDYHLRLLERSGAVWSRREGRVRRCYPRGQAVGPPGARSALEHPKGRALADLVAGAPGITLGDAAQRAGLSPSLASWHLERLVATGAVRRERAAGRVRFYPSK